MAKGKVLVVDDEIEFSDIIAERLRSRDFEVDTAESGEAGLEQVKSQEYDAIVLDLAMPGMDGIETMERMLEHDGKLQIIILTGHGSVEKGVQAVKKGAVDFLEKPADIEELAGKVSKAQETRVALFQEELEKKMSDITRKKGW
jgi:DNA-binding NtrC family response regulator